MKTKTILKTLAVALLMPAMLLTTACSSDDNIIDSEKSANTKGYALPVTVNVTRGDGATRATYNESTRKLEFSTGDKLFVEGPNNGGAGQFAGTLTWQSGGTFSGTIYTQNPYSGTADELFSAATSTATLLPNGYDAKGINSFLYVDNKSTTDIAYDDEVSARTEKAFVASGTAKATGVEQLSLEQASTYSDGFALAPVCAILNFTISGLEAGEKAVSLLIHRGTSEYTVTGSVTPNASGVATFAIGVPGGLNIKDMDNNLTVGTHNFTLPSSTTFAAGKIYNIARAAAIPGALNGQFSVSSTKKVYFSKGNLKYNGSTWSFFDNQYDYYTSYSADAWDKFGWSTSATTYGMDTSKDNNTYSGNFVDWGNNSELQSALGTGWFTLSSAEWTYLFNTRTTATTNMPTGTNNSAARYTRAKVAGVSGVILFPDNYAHPAGVTVTISNAAYNTGNNAYTTFTVDASNWVTMESAGCVFLPAASYRDGSSVINSSTGWYGNYWSATPNDAGSAYNVDFGLEYLYPAVSSDRYYGVSVRLVRQVE